MPKHSLVDGNYIGNVEKNLILAEGGSGEIFEVV